jgi:uncharacterized membrane protein YdjX (TVP38/TMEM64 family)
MGETPNVRDEGTAPAEKQVGGGWWKLVLAIVVVGGGVFAAWKLGLFEMLTMDNVDRLDAWFKGLGFWGPLVFVLVWIAACVFFLPGLPVTIVGGLVFGPVYGTIYSMIGATLGASMAFLVGRYAARDMVEGLIEKNKALQKIDDGVERQGWRMLMITRLVPVFPFNAQNYVYGLTKIPLFTYMLVSFLCMLPACLAFNFMAGAVRSGKSIGTILIYFAVGAIIFVLVSLLPGWIKKRYGADAALQKD